MKKIVFLFFLLYLNIFYGQFNYHRDWATYYGGEETQISDQAIDSQGNIYIVGSVSGSIPYSNSFVTVNSHQDYYGGGNSDGFIAKYNSNGNLLWATYYGGDEEDIINSITIENDNIYIAGSTNSIANIATPNSFSPNLPSGGNAGFIAKFSIDGVRDWGTYYVADTSISGIKSYNNTIIIFGETTNTNEIATLNSFQATLSSALPSSFISKFSRNGRREWSTYYYPPNNFPGFVSSICINNSGIYLKGFTSDNTGFYATPNCHQSQNNGSIDLFLSKFSFSGERLWSTYYGGTNQESTLNRIEKNIVCDENFIYITETTKSANYISTPNTYQYNYNNSPCLFLVKFDNSGTRQWGTYFGGGASVISVAHISLNIDSNDNCLVSGTTAIKNNISTIGSYQEQIVGSSNPNDGQFANNSDAFIIKFSNIGQRLWGTYYGGELNDSNSNTIIDNNEFYLCGTTNSTTGIATINSSQQNLNSLTNNSFTTNNAFIAKFSPIPLNTTSNSLENITLFPNPNTGNFTLQGNFSGDLAITIYDNQGRSVFSQETVSFQGKNTVAVGSKLSSGIYFVKVFNDNVAKTYKMIVK